MKFQFSKILFCVLALLLFSTITAQKGPVLNQKIIEYVNTVKGKKVDRGECWDLANRALKNVDAKWGGEYEYGKKLNTDKDTIYPGDLIQFSNVVLKFEKDGKKYTEMMQHHTAIVYEVVAKGEYKIAHQNTGQYGRKVGISDFNLKDMTKGKAIFYRAVQ